MDDVAKKTVFLRTPYNYDMDFASDVSGLECKEPTMTQQQFKDECDINVIVERFGLTGELPNNLRVPISDEFMETFDYRTSLDKLREADDAFMQMPAKIRAQFENNPGAFVDFVTDERNRDQVKAWGLTNPERKAAEPLMVKVVPEEPGKGAT